MTGDDLVARARAVASVARQAAAIVDKRGEFPADAVAALRAERLLAFPRGQRPSASALVAAVATVAGACGSTGLIWAMHLALYEVLCHHAPSSGTVAEILDEAITRQALVAGGTSEAGIGGEIRKSKAAVVTSNDVVAVEKRLETASYLRQADLILLTARRAADAPESDQVLVAATAAQSTITRETAWAAMGMRGTDSASATIRCRVAPDQVLPDAFADILSHTMVPYSHLLWSACWYGIAVDAAGVAKRAVRTRSTQAAEASAAARLRLADVHARLTLLHVLVTHAAQEVDSHRSDPLFFNELKVQAGELAVEIVLDCLRVVGVRGYLEDEASPCSLSRHVRDVLSSLVMVGNDRIRAANALLALVPSLEAQR